MLRLVPPDQPFPPRPQQQRCRQYPHSSLSSSSRSQWEALADAAAAATNAQSLRLPLLNHPHHNNNSTEATDSAATTPTPQAETTTTATTAGTGSAATPPAPIVVGRSPEEATLILRTLVISRRHASILPPQEPLPLRDSTTDLAPLVSAHLHLPRIVDHGGANGTSLNGRNLPRNEPVPLRDGDVVEFAPRAFRGSGYHSPLRYRVELPLEYHISGDSECGPSQEAAGAEEERRRRKRRRSVTPRMAPIEVGRTLSGSTASFYRKDSMDVNSSVPCSNISSSSTIGTAYSTSSLQSVSNTDSLPIPGRVSLSQSSHTDIDSDVGSFCCFCGAKRSHAPPQCPQLHSDVQAAAASMEAFHRAGLISDASAKSLRSLAHRAKGETTRAAPGGEAGSTSKTHMHSPPRPQPYPVAIVDLCDSDSDDSVVLLSPTKKARTYGESDAAATTARHESSDNAGTGRSASRWRDSKGKAPAYSSSSSSLGDANRTVADAGSSSDDKGVEGSVMDVVTIEDEPETVRAADPIRSAETGGNDRPDGSGGTKRNVVSKSPDVGRKSPALADAIQENEGEGNRTGASGNTETQNATNFLRDTLTSQLTCPICFDLLLLPHTITPCGHTYCGPCIFDWIQRSPSTGPAPPRKHRQKNRGTCPQCREGISGTPTPQVAMKALVEAVIPKLGLSDQEIKERAEREEAFKAHKRDANASTSGATGTRRTGPMDRFLPRIGHAGERGEAARVAVEMNRPVPLLEAMEPLGLGVIPPPPPQPHLHQPLTGLDFAYPMVGFDYGHMGIQNRAPNGPLFMPPQPVVSGPPAALPAQGTVEFWLANLLAAGRNGHEEEDDEEAVYSVEHASTGRAICRTCRALIAHSALRVRVSIPGNTARNRYHFDQTLFHHPACLVRSGTLPARILAAPEVWVGGWTRLSDADRRELEAAWRGGLPPGLVLVG